ncbi:MAG: BrnA antitoxin family protein [Elusimicrobia bacterium]|nr:BrnA antitoxin family protein [Elusimicrobiota bacterium]
MKKIKEFPFKQAHRVTGKEVEMARKAIEAKLGVKRPSRGRPLKGPEKYKSIQIRLNPKALEWALAQAKHRGIGYQTLINEILMQRATGRHAHHTPHK